jgi:hypothetical protein
MKREQRNKIIQRLELLELRLDGLNSLSYNISDKGGIELLSVIDETKLEIMTLERTLATSLVFLFNFIGGGWNSEVAYTEEEAIEQAVFKYGHPDTQMHLRVDTSTFRVSTTVDHKNLMSMFY